MAAATTLKYLTVPAIGKHTATVLFVHGLGDTGHGWKPVADMFKADPALAHVKWILPHSPTRTVKANMGIEMPSWFDIYSFGFDTDEDEMGMLQSARMISGLISAEVDGGIDPRRIVLGGFSQGGAMSLLTGLTGERKLAGVAVLSGWLPLRNKFKAMASQHAASIPVFWGHGAADPLVKYQFCKDSADFLTQTLGMPLAPTGECKGLSYNIYEGMGHTTTQKELDDLREWIKKAIPGEEAQS
ncbi:uncharacterized protein LACBIDRAFT_188773 [Laccaria bicolor S238N-H82]|uniref:Acyl-protein thioesterase 1 n=1 Tax=Laccaria bicolor (strain S238N-H82 / ATCC MYA-4686) TaxID=486041 RepID=B0CXJ7_LACBS|nr:uncharacterized protein LACBIDRAFT_188773 [Laccaria bicolor S238N-H82]EDR12736.1 predicted protein [Laccaria bicolor S238N-H82]|eukprot:XP_001877000.1 predicted protein [Laccaria bicolor S238N-H82]